LQRLGNWNFSKQILIPNWRIFIKHCNPKAIQQMQQKVIDYEHALERQAELLEQQEHIKKEQVQLQKQLLK